MDEHDFNARLGAEIRHYRYEWQLSQAELADEFGWERGTLNRIELGQYPVSVWHYLKILQRLRSVVPPDHPGLALADRLLGAVG